MSEVIAIINTMNPVYVVAAAVAQQVLAMAWFGCIVRHLDRYYVAADKGVRRVEHAIQRYPGVLISGATFLCSVLRTIVVLALVSTFNYTTMQQYQTAAGVAAIMGMTRIHRIFSCQRPIALFITESGYELMAALTAATVCFFMKEYKF